MSANVDMSSAKQLNRQRKMTLSLCDSESETVSDCHTHVTDTGGVSYLLVRLTMSRMPAKVYKSFIRRPLA